MWGLDGCLQTRHVYTFHVEWAPKPCSPQQALDHLLAASRRSPINHIMTHCRQYHGAKSLHNTRLHWPSAAATTKHCCACLTNKNREQVEPTKKTNKCGTLLCQALAACKVNNTANKHTHWAQPEWTIKKSPLHSTRAQLNLTKLASVFWVGKYLVRLKLRMCALVWGPNKKEEI